MQSSEREHPVARPVESDAGADALDLLTGAILGYMTEVDAYWQLCSQHERTTVASVTEHALRLAKRFPWSPAAVAYLRRAVGDLPSWDESPLWDPEDSGCIALQELQKTTGEGTAQSSIITRGIAWEGRHILVLASSDRDQPVMELHLVLARGLGELPDLPLRQAAICLMCHDALVPEAIASPLPAPAPCPPGLCTIRELLERAMPKNLYASKCFPPPGAEQ
jgi:hypothetical protein